MKVKAIMLSLLDIEIHEDAFSLSMCTIGITWYGYAWRYRSLIHVGWHNGWVGLDLFWLKFL